MDVGWGQLEREQWQGGASGLGTLSPGPPPLPPSTESLLLVALPLLGGRAGAFSRGPWSVVRFLIRLEVGLRTSSAPPLGIGGAEVGSLG
jgi:hypothetical protein